MEQTKYDYNQWMTNWPPSHVTKVFEGPDASQYVGIGMSMMLYLKTQARLGQIQTNKIMKTLADGTQIIATTCFGNDSITIIRPEIGEEIIIELPPEYILLFLVYKENIKPKTDDFRMFLVDLQSSLSTETENPTKFWKDEDFYLGPWEEDFGGFSGGFGSGTASSLSDFWKSRDPLILNTINHFKWHLVIDNNWNLSGLTYFPTLVLMNVPGAATHSMLSSTNCFDYPLCMSAIIPANSCALCFAYWPFHGVLPLTGQSFYIMPEVWVPLMKYVDDLNGDPEETLEWTKKSQVWGRGAVTGTPTVDITGKQNYSITISEKKKLKHALTYRESIYFDGSKGIDTRTGNWWNTWNEVLHIYQPCWVDISRGFGGDESGWWPFWNWLHETPTTGIASYAAYANYIWGGNTRGPGGWGMHWLKYDPEDPEADPVEEGMALNALNETLIINDGVCTLGHTTDNIPGAGCDFLWGAFDNAYADGSYSGKFFFPVATLGNKRFIYFENVFSGFGSQTGYRHVGGYYWCNQGEPGCSQIGPCCTSGGWYCFGLCPGCKGAPSLYCQQGQNTQLTGSQNHTFSLTQTFKIGKVFPGSTVMEDIIIDTGVHQYSHQLSVDYNNYGAATSFISWPSDSCDDVVSHCGCNSGPGPNVPAIIINVETDTYSRNITTFEVVDYCSNPKNDDMAIVYKKIVIQHSCSTTGDGSQTNWVHSGSRVVTWHLYLNVAVVDENNPSTTKREAKTFDLPPTFTAARTGGNSGSTAIHSGSGNRVYGASLQINDDYLAFSYLEEAWGGLGANFNTIIGQNMYPGPMNLEDRNVEPFYDLNGQLVWANVGCVWNPSKYYYGIIALHAGYPLFKKWEWSLDMAKDKDGEDITDGTNKKVYTVGLLVNNQETEERMAA